MKHIKFYPVFLGIVNVVYILAALFAVGKLYRMISIFTFVYNPMGLLIFWRLLHRDDDIYGKKSVIVALGLALVNVLFYLMIAFFLDEVPKMIGVILSICNVGGCIFFYRMLER
ncbi:MAG: hypothetical protein J6B28_07825 [Eubacterium sp.]|nr:hypothetical protein [Eubacterium sp.]